MFDTHLPTSLKDIQLWFGSIIGRPIDENSQINPISPTGQRMDQEVARLIKPSHTLQPLERIQIYNQQYWWRLLNTLHDTFPLTTTLFGYYDFNATIGMPYLVKYPPCHWSLGYLGERLPLWVAEEYQAEDKLLISYAAQLDWAYNQSFVIKGYTPITLANLPVEGNPHSLLGELLYLQPSVCLFDMPFNLFTFRQEFIQQKPDYWLEQEFPYLKKEKQYHFILYRHPFNHVCWEEISLAESSLIKQFKQGSTIEGACEWLEQQETALVEEAASQLACWFRDWIIKGLLTLERTEEQVNRNF